MSTDMSTCRCARVIENVNNHAILSVKVLVVKAKNTLTRDEGLGVDAFGRSTEMYPGVPVLLHHGDRSQDMWLEMLRPCRRILGLEDHFLVISALD